MSVNAFVKGGMAVALLMTSGAPGFAQTTSNPPQVPATGLNLPTEITPFGKTDPYVRKATAIVNNDIITGTDIDQRLALVVLANQGKVSDDERARLRLQVLRNLIDEALQIQEAKAHEITITPAEIDQTYLRWASQFKRSPEVMTKYLHDQGSSERSVKRQMQAELAWSRLLRRRIEPNVNVSDEEGKQVLARLEAARGSAEFHVAEIYLSATPDNQNEIAANSRKIIDQIRQGGSFAAYATQFSEATTASVGGDLGWVRPGLLPEAVATAVQGMEVGQVVGPVPIPGGVDIVYLVDKRQVLTADPRDAQLNLRQMSLKFPPGIGEAEATSRAETFAKATRNMGGCGKVEPVARTLGAEVVDNDAVKVRDLPPALQAMLLKLSIGEATPPFGTQKDGVRVLVLCGRDDAKGANAPTLDQVRSSLENTRVNQRAQRYLRDLRRDAVVDYR